MENRITMGNAITFSKQHSDNKKEEYLTENLHLKFLHETNYESLLLVS
jgi:hypothetical protein